MSEILEHGQFLGIPQCSGAPDIVIVPLAYELTTSYGTGACDGPKACIEASTQVELYDDRLGYDLPGAYGMKTLPAWVGQAPTLRGQLDEMVDFVSPCFDGEHFPIFLGGEHGILPPLIRAARLHPLVDGDLSKLSVVQLDAHADLREDLDGEIFSHACAASRALDVGIGALYQAGIRAYSKEEAQRIEDDAKITTFFARQTQHPTKGPAVWREWIETLQKIRGPVHLTIDIDGLDGALVPATGTPVPGGLTFWQAVETIETLFENPHAFVISADVNEIVPQAATPLTQFTAACLVSRVIASHIFARENGRWKSLEKGHLEADLSSYFSQF